MRYAYQTKGKKDMSFEQCRDKANELLKSKEMENVIAMLANFQIFLTTSC